MAGAYRHHRDPGAAPLRSTPLDASDAELAAFREAMSSMEVGWGQTLESLAGFLSTAR
ncbi:MAG TPA: hypothetical protein VK902_10725 [Rubrobacter sp.]|nr:hypothetical protein [Rubrobacter sp.]